jgi:acetyl-CoA decarbonylase/synthase complex subunit gamma
MGRMRFTVQPGLYALGTPGSTAPVLVTANYKMSFDRLRAALSLHNAWILVLDTKGINVWCAAGKGTFGTQELIRRIGWSGLIQLVSHRQVILPQLAGPGVAAHQVKKHSGFRVVYGPVRAEDLPEFIRRGLKALNSMRRKTFTIRERAVLIPVELVSAVKWGILVCIGLVGMAGLLGPGDFWTNIGDRGAAAAAALFCALAAGAVLTPLLLPWVPGRAFSMKGLFMGLAAASLLAVRWHEALDSVSGLAMVTGLGLMTTGLSAYLAMNFTGSSTFTSLSGVRKEMKWAVPMEIAACGLGLLFWVGSLFTV